METWVPQNLMGSENARTRGNGKERKHPQAKKEVKCVILQVMA